ncbi:hypothetical protein C0J52_05308 [Blattella germanica]|nr:hypothetical protein C0J52_05308 [Blattella germanica]
MTGLGSVGRTRVGSDKLICIAKENIIAERPIREVISFNLRYSDSVKVITLGSLIEVQSKTPDNKLSIRIINSFGDAESCEWVCSARNLLPLNPIILPSLLAVIEPSERIGIVENEHIFCELASLATGKKVMLLPKYQDSRCSQELAVVRYKGPIPEMGPGTYYGLELLVHSGNGENDGTIFGKRYFHCPNKCGIFVALNRLRLYRSPKTLNIDKTSTREFLRNCKIHPEPSIPTNTSMPSNERRIHQNGGNHDPGNFKTTLVLHLKEKDSMPRNNQTSKLEKTEKLIDLDLSGENGDSSNVPLKVGDKVVWLFNNSPEPGIVRWLGNIDGLVAGVEFDKPIGDCSGAYKKEQYFQTRKNHGQFIPLVSLVKAEDFYVSSPIDHKKKYKNMKLIENCSNSKSNQQNNSSRSQPVNSRKLDGLPKTQRSESYVWSNHLVELSDSATNNSQSKENLIQKESDDNICRSEYVFSESNLDHSPVTSKAESISKRSNKDSKNNNVGKKSAYNLSSYPIGEANPRDYFSSENIPGSRRMCDDRTSKAVKSSEGKIRHSYSQDLQSHHSTDDFLSELWPPVSENQHKNRIKEERRTKTALGPNGKPAKLNNTPDPHLEVVDLQDPILSASPSGSSGGSSYYELPDCIRDSPEPEQIQDLGVGSVVEVTVNGEPLYGVIRWIGTVPEDKKSRKVAGVEMEEEHVGCTDGTFNGRRYFQCNPKKAMFVSLSTCRKDSRFQDVHPALNDTKVKPFGQQQCPVIPGAVRPISSKGDLESLCGKYRGIQGHHNSCYLDATLFSIVFDNLLFRPQNENDIQQYQEVQKVLREEIVNPLRQNLYVRADRVMKLRTLLENLSSVTGLTSEEKDPEEFLTSLVAQILRAEPFLKLSSGQEAYHYQLFVEKDEHLILPSVQQLFEQSFLTSDIKLKEMPRFGKSFKMYPRILPSQLLDVTDIIEDLCGKSAGYECKECFGEFGVGLESIAFCEMCLDTDHCPVPRLYMELFAVVCIETSHYVAFVKCGSGSEAPWCFFDSMADRKGEQNGYNIPEMVSCPNLPYWLSDEGARSLQEMKDDRQLPEHAKRLLCDAYMCMYQSPDVMMYR